jgi:ABC-type Fe3+ transport system substrate-binding protein
LIGGFAAPEARAAGFDQIANMTGPDRQKVLEEGAKKEKEVLMIGGINAETASRPILKAFMAKYPFINAKEVRQDTNAALQRILAETRAKASTVDLVVATIVVDMKHAGLVQPFVSPALAAYPKEVLDPERNWAVISYTYRGLAAYNTKLVTDAAAPKTVDDLLDPKWKGKMIWTESESGGGPAFITYMRQLRGEEKAVDYIQRLSKQNVIVNTASARTIVDLVVAGEHEIMISPALHHIADARAKTAPINATMEDPVAANPSYFMLLKTAPHPHAALLLADFLLEKEAQTVLRNALYFPAHPEIDAHESMKALQPKTFGYKTMLQDDEMLIKNAKVSSDLFKKYFMQ